MTTTAIQAAAVHQPCELGHYSLPEGARVLVGRTVDGELRVFDRPRHGNGRPYFVEAGFSCDQELAVLLADYRRQAARFGACPMSREAISKALSFDPSAEPTPPQRGTP